MCSNSFSTTSSPTTQFDLVLPTLPSSLSSSSFGLRVRFGFSALTSSTTGYSIAFLALLGFSALTSSAGIYSTSLTFLERLGFSAFASSIGAFSGSFDFLVRLGFSAFTSFLVSSLVDFEGLTSAGFAGDGSAEADFRVRFLGGSATGGDYFSIGADLVLRFGFSAEVGSAGVGRPLNLRSVTGVTGAEGITSGTFLARVFFAGVSTFTIGVSTGAGLGYSFAMVSLFDLRLGLSA